MRQRFLCWLFSVVYKKYLYDDIFDNYAEVERVFSWRSARVVFYSQTGRRRSVRWIQPCFWWFK